jgi:hypothetical protein
MPLIARPRLDPAARDYARGALRYFLLVLLVPLICGAAGPWTSYSGMLAFLIGLVVTAAAAIGGAIYWLIRAMALDMRSEKAATAWWMALPFALLLLSAPAAAYLGAVGTMLGHLARLTVEHRQYEAIIARAPSVPREVARSEPTEGPNHVGLAYRIEHGPPLRVMFRPDYSRWMAGSIVYDESGDVMNGPGPPGFGEFRPRVGEIMSDCARLWRKYEVCWADW